MVAFKNCAPFRNCAVKINDGHTETAENLEVIMPMYNLIEYSDNYQDSSASLYYYKRDDSPPTNGGDNASNITPNNSNSFKYKAELSATIDGGNTIADDAGRKIDNAKFVVPLKYLSNFFRALEMPLINCNVHLELNWKKGCLLANTGNDVKFHITDTKLYVPVITLLAKDNINFTNQQNESFKRSVYWNKYKSVSKNYDRNLLVPERINLDPSFQGVNRLFALAFDRRNNHPTVGSHR